MTDFETLKKSAYETKIKFRSGSITVGEAKKELKEFEKAFNARAKEKAVKYNVKPQKLSVLMWLNMDI